MKIDKGATMGRKPQMARKQIGQNCMEENLGRHGLSARFQLDRGKVYEGHSTVMDITFRQHFCTLVFCSAQEMDDFKGCFLTLCA